MKTRSSPSEVRNSPAALLERVRKAGSKGASQGTQEIPARTVAELSAKALVGNYEALRVQVPRQSILPMVKADGYGHGAVFVARTLLGLPALNGFGVATLDEGAELRQGLGPKARRSRILVFSGALPWSEEKGQFCEAHGLTPVLATDSDWNSFLKGGWPGKLPYELKFNTGMNRLGLSAQSARSVVKSLSAKPPEWHPQGIFSHLAIGERPEDRLSLSQRERFEAIRSETSSAFPATQFHLGNSAGIWNQKHWRLDGLTDVVRPGISLYGVPPWPGAPERGIVPVMTLRAFVLAIHELKPGEGIGYGASYVVPRNAESPVRAAIVSAGYADGIHRALSGRGEGTGGYAWVGGRASRMLGAVSMDLCAIECPATTRIGDSVEFMGSHVDAWAQARAAGTIPYELLTSVSRRVKRIYG